MIFVTKRYTLFFKNYFIRILRLKNTKNLRISKEYAEAQLDSAKKIRPISKNSSLLLVKSVTVKGWR